MTNRKDTIRKAKVAYYMAQRQYREELKKKIHANFEERFARAVQETDKWFTETAPGLGVRLVWTKEN